MGEGEENGSTTPTSETEGLIIAPIQVLIPADFSDEDSEEEEKVQKKQKKKKKRSSVVSNSAEPKPQKLDKTMLLTKTFGQALRMINEQKVMYCNSF